MEWVYLISAVASSIAAVLAWAAKLWWGREFAASKDEIIKAKEAQIELLTREIESLRELTPMKIREYFLSVREQMEEYNDLLKNQLAEAKQELDKKQEEIERFRLEGDKNLEEIEKLEAEKEKFARAAAQLQAQIDSLRKKYESDDVIIYRIPKVDPQTFENINMTSKALAKYMSRDVSKEIAKISKVILENYDIAKQQQEMFKYIQQIRKTMAYYQPSTLSEDDDKVDVDDDENGDEVQSDAQPNPA